MTQVCFDKAVHFKKEYSQALENGLEQFDFDNCTYHIGFAKYVVQYLEQRGII